MSKKRRRLRKNKNGLYSPRKVLDEGCYMRLSFQEKVFTALTWFGFTNAEAWGVINPLSEASANSRGVMAGRYACNPWIKRYIEILNEHLYNGTLSFKKQEFKIGEQQAEDAVSDYRNKKEWE